MWQQPCAGVIVREPGTEDRAMVVTGERRGDVLWLSVSGRISALNATQFEEEVGDAIDESDRAVIMDCGNLVYISSAGLCVVLRTAKNLRQRGAVFAICALSDPIRENFERIGIDNVVVIHPTGVEALASVIR